MMTDLHTHILPGMDDGSQNVTTTNILIQNEIENGVKQIAFTPHYICADEPLSSFLARRAYAYSLVDVRAFLDVEFKLGAEVYFCDELFSLSPEELYSLCLSGTHYFFLEFSMSHRQERVGEFLELLIRIGLTPVLVHIERFDYLKTSDIKKFVALGCVIQCNCESLLRNKKETSHIKSLASKGLVHIFATDTHSVARRPVNMAAAMAVLDAPNKFIRNADKIFWDRKIRA